jgi:hypothetical protein
MAWTIITPSPDFTPFITGTSYDGEFITDQLYKCGQTALNGSFTIQFKGNVPLNDDGSEYFSAQTVYNLTDSCSEKCEPIVAWFSGGTNQNNIIVNNENINYIKMKRIDCEIVVYRSDSFMSNPYVLNGNFYFQNNYSSTSNTACVSCANSAYTPDVTSSCANTEIWGSGNIIEVGNANHVVKFWPNSASTNGNKSITYYHYIDSATTAVTSSTTEVGNNQYKINGSEAESATMITGNNYLLRLYIPGSTTKSTCPIRYIGKESFKDNKNLSALTVGCDVGIIGENAFSGCTSLTYIDFPREEKYVIANSAFTNCCGSSDTKLDLKDVLSIGNSSFKDCTKLTKVRIGGTIENIQQYAFSGCANLSEVWICKKYPPYLGSGTSQGDVASFGDVFPSGVKIKVPKDESNPGDVINRYKDRWHLGDDIDIEEVSECSWDAVIAN